MKTFIILITLFYSSLALSFTLSHQPPRKFSNNKVTVNVSSNNCDNSETAAGLLNLVEKAINEHWNSIATCALELNKGSVIGVDLANDDPDAFDFSKVPVGTILVGCNTNLTGSTLGVAANSGADRGVVLVHDGSTSFANLSESNKVATIAHEIGHAIGLGHSSDPVALMYYAVGGVIREKLTLDDYDACSYLYPHESPGSCNSIAPISDDEGNPTGRVGYLLLMVLGFMATILAGRLFRSRM